MRNFHIRKCIGNFSNFISVSSESNVIIKNWNSLVFMWCNVIYMEITIGRVNSHYYPMLVEVITLEALRHERSLASRVVIFIVTLKRSLWSIKHRVKYVVSCCDDKPFFWLMLKHPHNRNYCFLTTWYARVMNFPNSTLHISCEHFL